MYLTMPRMRLLTACLGVFVLAFSLTSHAQQRVQNPVVVQFMIDGIDANTVRTAVANGATTVGTLLKQGVTVQT